MIKHFKIEKQVRMGNVKALRTHLPHDVRFPP
jgi:hypothetical protein